MLRRLPPLSDLRIYKFKAHRQLVLGILENVGKDGHCIEPPDIDLTLIVLLTLLEQASYPIQLLMDNFNDAKISIIEQRLAYREQGAAMLQQAAVLRDMIDFRETPRIVRFLNEKTQELVDEAKMLRRPFGGDPPEVTALETEVQLLRVFVEMLHYKLNPLS